MEDQKTKEAHVQSEETFSSGNRNFRSESRKISAHKKFRNNTDCSVTLLFPRWSVRQPRNFSLNPFLILNLFQVHSFMGTTGRGSVSKVWVLGLCYFYLGARSSSQSNPELSTTQNNWQKNLHSGDKNRILWKRISHRMWSNIGVWKYDWEFFLNGNKRHQEGKVFAEKWHLIKEERIIALENLFCNMSLLI